MRNLENFRLRRAVVIKLYHQIDIKCRFRCKILKIFACGELLLSNYVTKLVLGTVCDVQI